MLISFLILSKLIEYFYIILLFSGPASIVIILSPYTGIHFPPLMYVCQFAPVLTDKSLTKLDKAVCISHEGKLIYAYSTDADVAHK